MYVLILKVVPGLKITFSTFILDVLFETHYTFVYFIEH